RDDQGFGHPHQRQDAVPQHQRLPRPARRQAQKSDGMNAKPGPASARPYRGRITLGFFAHLFKAAFKQHHRALLPLLRPLIAIDAVVLDVGAHAGQYAKLFAKLAPRGRIYAVEPQSYARRILRVALALNRLRNVTILPLALGAKPGRARLTIPVKASAATASAWRIWGLRRARARRKPKRLPWTQSTIWPGGSSSNGSISSRPTSKASSRR